MATKAEVLASIKDGSIFANAEMGRTERLKAELVDRIAERKFQRILFVGPIKPTESPGREHGASSDYGPNGLHYQGD